MLYTFHNLLSPTDLADIRQALTRASAQGHWEDGAHSAGAQARAVKNNQQLPHDCRTAEQVRTRVLAALEQHAGFFSAALPLRVFPPRINRYTGGANHYGVHVDNAIRSLGNGQRVRTDLSCTVFLNDPSDYDGGELTIHDTFGTHAIKLPAGSAVLYPGSSLHEVRPVTRGERLACFFWIESLVRSDEQRRLLHELDTQLLNLRTRDGESTEAVALTGVYHNLLRLWAQT